MTEQDHNKYLCVQWTSLWAGVLPFHEPQDNLCDKPHTLQLSQSPRETHQCCHCPRPPQCPTSKNAPLACVCHCTPSSTNLWLKAKPASTFPQDYCRPQQLFWGWGKCPVCCALGVSENGHLFKSLHILWRYESHSLILIMWPLQLPKLARVQAVMKHPKTKRWSALVTPRSSGLPTPSDTGSRLFRSPYMKLLTFPCE